MTKKIETKKTTSNKISKAAMVAAASLGVGLTVLPQVANITHLTDKTENVASASRVSTLKVGQMSVDLLDADGYVYDAGTPVYQSFSGDWCVGLVLIEMPVANEVSQKIVKVPAKYVTGITSQSFTVNQKLVLGEDNLIGMSDITGPVVNTTTEADKSALNSAIQNAQAKVSIASEYTADSIAKLKTELSKAQAVANDKTATQSQVDTSVSSLQQAINALKNAPKTVDKTGLQSLISATTAAYQTPAKYTAETYAPFKAAYDSAVSVVSNASATALQVDDATFLLNNKFSALVVATTPSVDKTGLQAAVSKAVGLVNSGKYTDESVATVNKAIESAQAVIGNAQSTQDSVNQAAATLQTAISALVEIPVVPEVERDALNAAIAKAQKLTTSTEYTAASIDNLKAKVAAAITVRDNKTSTQTDVDAATTALETAIDGLVAKPVEVDALQASIDKATTALTNEDYTGKSRDVLKDVIAKAEQVLNDSKHKQAEVDAATKTVDAAMTELVKRATDAERDALAKHIDEATVKADSDEFTDKSKDSVKDIIKQVSDSVKDEDLSSEDVKALETKLDGAVTALAVKATDADYTKLSDAIAKAKAISTDKYTDKSVDDLKKAITSAEKELKNEDASASDIANSVKALEKAVAGLATKATPKPATPATTTTPTKPTTGGTSQSTTTTPAATTPAAQATPAAPAAQATPAPTYIVQDGDTLTGIAQKLGTSVDYLVSANGVQNPDLIFAGDVLKVGEATQATQATQATPAASETEGTTSAKAETTKGSTDTAKSEDKATAKTSSKDKSKSETKQEVKATDDKSVDDDVKTDSKTEKSNGNGFIAVILGALAGLGGYTYFSRKKK